MSYGREPRPQQASVEGRSLAVNATPLKTKGWALLPTPPFSLVSGAGKVTAGV